MSQVVAPSTLWPEKGTPTFGLKYRSSYRKIALIVLHPCAYPAYRRCVHGGERYETFPFFGPFHPLFLKDTAIENAKHISVYFRIARYREREREKETMVHLTPLSTRSKVWVSVRLGGEERNRALQLPQKGDELLGDRYKYQERSIYRRDRATPFTHYHCYQFLSLLFIA